MPDAAELLKLLKRSMLDVLDASDPMKILFGRVEGTEPLEIVVDQKMKLGKQQLILSRNVTDYETEITLDAVTDKMLDAHAHSLSIDMEEAGEPLHTHAISGSLAPEDLGHSHRIQGRVTVTVHNRLAAGDRVILLKNKGGQQYLVVDRAG